MQKLRVFIVDDSPFYRKVLKDLIVGLPGVEVVGTANDGRMALEELAQVQADVVTLDVEMPVMGGLKTLVAIREKFPHLITVMVSAHTDKSAKTTIDALEAGAFDFVTKPSAKDVKENWELLNQQLESKMEACRRRMMLGQSQKNACTQLLRKQKLMRSRSHLSSAPTSPLQHRIQIIGIAVSTGGPTALKKVLQGLEPSLPVPVVVVQHMPEGFVIQLAKSINRASSVEIKVPDAGEELKNGVVYLAPGNKHMKVCAKGRKHHIVLSDDPKEHSCRPAADFLFRSLAKEFGQNALGVILTGMGRDGVLGLTAMRKEGAYAIAQNEASCTIYGMPKEAIEAGVIDLIADLSDISYEINRLTKLHR